MSAENDETPHYLDNLESHLHRWREADLQAYLDALREEIKKLAEETATPIHLWDPKEYERWQQRSYEGHWY